jgi:hypothetical protein
MSLRLAPSTASPTGMPSASTSRLRLAPRLARSVGFFPVFFPPEGRLGHAPVHRHPGPVQALQVVVGHQAGLPHVLEEAGFDPLLEAVMGGRSRAELGGVEGLPLAAGAEDEEDGVHADAVGGAGPAAAEAVGVLVLGDQFGDGLPEVVGDAPVIGDGTLVHADTCGWRPAAKDNKCSCIKTLYSCESYPDRL